MPTEPTQDADYVRTERNRLAEAFIRGIEAGADDPALAGDGDAMYAAFRRWAQSDGQDGRVKCWFWDAEGDPRHADCGGEVTFFQTLSDEEAAICLSCCECGLNWREVPTRA